MTSPVKPEERQLRPIDCPVCGGDGGFEHLTGINPSGEPTGYWTGCEACEGTGQIEVEDEPIEEDDLAAMSGTDDEGAA